jgi:hypothetical protein
VTKNTETRLTLRTCLQQIFKEIIFVTTNI